MEEEDHEPRNVDGKECGQAGSVKKRIFPQSFQEGTQPYIALLLAQWDPFQTSDLQNFKIINVHSFTFVFVVICYNIQKKLIWYVI